MNPIKIIAEKLRGHPCEKIVKQTEKEIKLSGASVGIGDFKVDVGKYSDKIIEFHKVTTMMVAIDNSQYHLCTTIFKMNLSDELKDTVNRIRLQIMVAFDQLHFILGSIEQNSTPDLEKQLEEWVQHMGDVSKKSIDALAPIPPEPEPVPEVSYEKFEEKPDALDPSYYSGKKVKAWKMAPDAAAPSPSLDTVLEETREFQGLDKYELDEAIKILS